MADPEESYNPTPESVSINSHDTALSIIPPRHLWPAIDRLRELYDKAYEKWPPHLNLVYPFVRLESLERAAELLQSGLSPPVAGPVSAPLKIRLDAADVFSHRHDNTIFLHDEDDARTEALQALRGAVLQSLGQKKEVEGGGHRHHRLHLTIGQSEDLNGSAHKFLLRKANLLPALEWEAEKLNILVRERTQVGGMASSRMKSWGTVDLRTSSITREGPPTGFYEQSYHDHEDSETAEIYQLQTRPPFHFDEETRQWRRLAAESKSGQDSVSLKAVSRGLAISSYNVLAEFEYPPSQERYPVIIQNILSVQAAADVLVLQEVTDDFLSHLLGDEDVRATYPYVSHGPPDQGDVEPLPSFLNMVVLSRWGFDWEWVSFKRQHKGSLVARLRGEAFGKWEDGEFLPLVLATVHLTHGLVDGAISNKKIELQRILSYLAENYEGHPWVLAGDFNITTSKRTIDDALKKGDITAHTAGYVLEGFEKMLSEAGFVDTWAVFDSHRESAGTDDGDDNGEFECEHGATFDPMVNKLATKMVGSGANNRPQRYDRILLKGEDVLEVARFNRFGFPQQQEDGDGIFASDHWGVRCALKPLGAKEAEEDETVPDEISSLIVPVEFKKASHALADVSSLRDTLSSLGTFPTREEAEARQAAFNLLKSILLENPTGEAIVDGSASGCSHAATRLRSSLVMVPVGSYGLGVWTPSSDIDCLCVGPYSSTTFFALAVQRIRKTAAASVSASGGGKEPTVKLLRRVRAHTGTMLELEVLGVRMDLQYCAATAVAERWPEALDLPVNDPIFTLPPQTLGKLKAARDLDYLRKSVPDLAKFRLAHRAIKTWACGRGIYSARFGYLGGIQISVLLARVCKFLALKEEEPSSGPVSVTDILVTFFNHYAAFDWGNKLVFDPFFHTKRLNYTRTSREPLAILGYFPPVLNTSHAASVPSVRTIAEELRRADELLSCGEMSWLEFFCGKGKGEGGVATPASALANGAADFLRSYKTYAKIELQYWGMSLSRGSQFVGWLESRCPMVLVDISRRLPGVHARMWPARFVAADEPDDGGSSSTPETTTGASSGVEEAGSVRDYQGCYLIGLDAPPSQSLGDNKNDENRKEEARAAAGALQTVLRRFEDLIRGDEKYFDARCQWMSASVVRRSELGRLVVDSREWGEYTPGDDEEDGEDEGQAEEEEESLDDGEGAESGGATTTTTKKRRKTKTGKGGRKVKGQPANAAAAPKGGKFRTAADVMNRLRWDPGLDSLDYIVGYEDRFVGAMERALDAWKTEQTDEEFIPQHRILYFKRKTDGVVVWERRTRKDEVFGSG